MTGVQTCALPIYTFGLSSVLASNLNGEGRANIANNTEHQPATIGQLAFANPPAESTVDNGRSPSPITSTQELDIVQE